MLPLQRFPNIFSFVRIVLQKSRLHLFKLPMQQCKASAQSILHAVGYAYSYEHLKVI